MALLVVLTGAAACARGDGDDVGAATVVLAGSTSVLPFAERWAELYGGGKVTVQAGGSTAGIRAARDGTADIGMSSRALRGDEAAGLVATPVARDGVAIIVHEDNPVRALSLAQLRALEDEPVEATAHALRVLSAALLEAGHTLADRIGERYFTLAHGAEKRIG